MKTAKFNVIAVFVLLTGFFMSGGCEKDENAKKIICDNLLKQGVADTNLLKGSWSLTYLGKTTGGKNVKAKDSTHEHNVIINFDSSNIKKMNLKVVNAIYFTIKFNSINNVDMRWKGSTYAYSPPLEKKIVSVLDNAICYVVKRNQLIFYYQVKDDDDNVVVFKKK